MNKKGENAMGIRVEIKQRYHGIEMVLNDMEEVKGLLDSILPFMKQNLEIEIEFLHEEEEKEEEDGE